jgi:hypothetical protein
MGIAATCSCLALLLLTKRAKASIALVICRRHVCMQAVCPDDRADGAADIGEGKTNGGKQADYQWRAGDRGRV